MGAVLLPPTGIGRSRWHAEEQCHGAYPSIPRRDVLSTSCALYSPLYPSPPTQNFAGMSEDQLIGLPPEVRTMVMAGATAVMAGAGAGGPGGGGMMPGGGMNMNGGPMMGQMMNMGPMMNQMMEMGVGMGDMGMGGDGSGAGQGQGVGVGAPEGQVGMGMGVGEGFGPGGAPGQGMMGMGMNPEFAMQVRGRRVVPLWKRLGRKIDERAVQDPTAMGQQMYPGMEGSGTPVPVAPAPTRGVAQGQFRGRGMPQGMRGRGVPFAGRGRGPLFMSVP